MKKFFIIFTIIFVPLCSVAQNISIEDFNREMNNKTQKFIGQPFIGDEDSRATLFPLKDKLKDKVVLVSFWFATCEPCIKEFNALNELNNKLRGNKNFELVAVTFETPKTIKKIKKQYRLNYTIVSIPEEKCEKLVRGCGYPTNVILDKKGIIKNWYSGGVVNSDAEVEKFMMDSIYPIIQSQL